VAHSCSRSESPAGHVWAFVGRAHDALHDPPARRRVGASERDVEERRVLDGADLLLAQQQVDELGPVPSRDGGRHPERVDRGVDPVGLGGVVEIRVQHHPLAAHVQGSMLDREVAVRRRADPVSVVGCTGGPDHVDQVRAVFRRGDRVGLVPVGLEGDSTLLADHSAIKAAGVEAHSCAIARHINLLSCVAYGGYQVTWMTTGVSPSGMYSAYFTSSPSSLIGASWLE